MQGNWEKRTESQEIAAKNSGGSTGECDGDQAARLPFKQEQLDREQHGGYGRGEGSRHSGSGAGDEQCLALGTGQMEELRDHRADSAAGHDNGAFGSEGSAGADGDRRGDGLEDGDFGLDAAAVDQNGFYGFGNAVTADAFRAVAGHDADNQRAGDGDNNAVSPQVISGGGNQRGAPVTEIK